MKRSYFKITALLLAVIIFIEGYYAQLRGIINIPPALSIGPFTFHWYGLALILGAAVVWAGFTREAKKLPLLKKVDPDLLFIYILIPALIGARIYHVCTDWQLYAAKPWEALYIWNGGLGIYGALAGGLLGALWYCHKHKISLLPVFDLLALFLPLAQFIGRCGNLINRELFGLKTDLPWGLYIPGKPGFYQPAFFYEQIGDLALFLVLFWYYQRAHAKNFKGRLLIIYLLGYTLIRFLVDFIRLEPRILFGTFTTAQTVALLVWIFFGVAFAIIKMRHRKQ